MHVKRSTLLGVLHTPYIFLIPSFLYMMLVMGYPILYAVNLALRDPVTGELTFNNIILAYKYYKFNEALFYTFAIILAVITLDFIIATLTAIYFFTYKFKGSQLVFYIFIVPLALSDVAAALIWYAMLSPTGYFNKFLLSLGVIEDPIQFFGYAFRDRTFIAIALAEVWRTTALVFIILYASIQLLNKEYFEAADVFGFSFLDKLRHIIIPLLKPAIESALVIRTLFALQVYATPLVLSGLDIPVLSTITYYWFTERFNVHVASVYALLIGFITLTLGILYIRVLRVRYEV
ncbi:MAG: carbohydrate ABC transporter permease [Acidilobaceae archaeon]